MKQKVLIALFFLIAGASVIGAVMSTAETAEFTIRIATLGSPEDEDYDGMLVLEEYVESRSGGRVDVQIYPSGQFCSQERECLEGLQTGVLQVYMFTTGGLGAVFGPGQVFDLPYMFRDDAVAECVLDGPIVDDLRETILDAGLDVRLMTVSNTGGWRNFATTDKPVRTPEDLRGLKIRTISAPIQQELVRQLGANPTPIAWSEVYTALATGVVVGTKNGIQDIVGMKLHEQLKHVVLDGHGYMGGLWWYSEPSWRELPPDLQRIVYDGFQQLKNVTRGILKRRQIDAYEEFRKAGGVIHAPSPAEKQRFREAAAGMRAWYADNYGDEWLEKIDAAVAQCERAIDERYRRAMTD